MMMMAHYPDSRKQELSNVHTHVHNKIVKDFVVSFLT